MRKKGENDEGDGGGRRASDGVPPRPQKKRLESHK